MNDENKKILDDYIIKYNSIKSVTQSIIERNEKANHYKNITKENIQAFTKEEMFEYLNPLWSLIYGAKKILEDNNLDLIKETIIYLLFGNDDIIIRWDNTASKLKHFRGAGMSELLAFTNPDKYFLYNNTADDYLKKLGFKPSYKKDGQNYQNVLDFVSEIKSIFKEKYNLEKDNLEIDDFLYFIACCKHEDENINKINYVYGGKAILIKGNVLYRLGTQKTEKIAGEKDAKNLILPYYGKMPILLINDSKLFELKIGLQIKNNKYQYTIEKEITDIEIPNIDFSEEKTWQNQKENKFLYEDLDIPTNDVDFLENVFLDDRDKKELLELLDFNKNIILMGPPGVGKTYAAKKIAYSLMGAKNDENIGYIQFHQSYTYENFILGYKPNETSYEVVEGIFTEFCKKAKANPDEKYFFIIDEINRGNISKIFGEVMVGIEADYRNIVIDLNLKGYSIEVPNNLYLIGAMNTADRSIAIMDYALKRRFAFFKMKPGFETDAFKINLKAVDSVRLNNLVDLIKEINIDISNDPTLKDNYEIGHSYFCNINEDQVNSVIKYKIIPLIEDYWQDNNDMIEKWTNKLLDI